MTAAPRTAPSQTKTPLPDWMLPGTAEKYTGAARVSLFTLALTGRLKYKTIGDRVFFSTAELTRIREERERGVA